MGIIIEGHDHSSPILMLSSGIGEMHTGKKVLGTSTLFGSTNTFIGRLFHNSTRNLEHSHAISTDRTTWFTRSV